MKEQKIYEIVLHVPSLSLTTVLDVVKDSTVVKSVRQIETVAPPTAHRHIVPGASK